VKFNEAKDILNHQNKTPYTDTEIEEIIKFLDIFSELIWNNLTKTNTL